MVCYVLSRTHRIHQIAITEIARIICSVEPEMLHHFYDEHRTEHRYVWPVRAVAGFIMRVKFSWGGTETAGTIFCLTMRIISHCQSRIVTISEHTELILTNLLPSSHPSGSWGRESEQTQECQGVSLSSSDWLLAARERCDWSMMGAWSLVTTQEMNDGPRSLR